MPQLFLLAKSPRANKIWAPSMKGTAAAGSRKCIECHPRCEWIKIGKFDTLLVDVSALGFKMEEMKVHCNTSGWLRVSGESLVRGNEWRRFAKSFRLPADCGGVEGIQANFDEGVLYVLLPKSGGEARGKGASRSFVVRRWRLILAVAVSVAVIAVVGTYAARRLQ